MKFSVSILNHQGKIKFESKYKCIICNYNHDNLGMYFY